MSAPGDFPRQHTPDDSPAAGVPAPAEAAAVVRLLVEPPDPELVADPTPEAVIERVRAYVEAGRTDVAILVLDLDGLKDVNDTFSHNDGDELIKATVEELQRATRHPSRGDNAPAADKRRVGQNRDDEILQIMQNAKVERKHGEHGDEFVILLVGVYDQETVDKVAKRIQAALKARIVTVARPAADGTVEELALAPYGIEASVGGKLYGGIKDGESVDSSIDGMYRTADIRMRHDKIERRLESLNREPQEVRRIVGKMVLWLTKPETRVSARRVMGYITAALEHYVEHPEELVALEASLDLGSATDAEQQLETMPSLADMAPSVIEAVNRAHREIQRLQAAGLSLHAISSLLAQRALQDGKAIPKPTPRSARRLK